MRSGETVRLRLPNWMDAPEMRSGETVRTSVAELDGRPEMRSGETVRTSVAELDGRAEMRSGETVQLQLPNWMDARTCGLERQFNFSCRIEWTRGDAVWRDS